MQTSNPPPKPPVRKGQAFSQMNGRQKFLFVVKLTLCILTFGMAFPNVMSD